MHLEKYVILFPISVGDAFTIPSCLDMGWQYYGESHGSGIFATVGIITLIMRLKEMFGGTT